MGAFGQGPERLSAPLAETLSDPVPLPPSPPVGTGGIEVDGARIAYALWSRVDGPTLLLVHGGRASSVWWHPVIAAGLTDRHRVVTLDLSGHGESDRRSSYHPQTWADELAAVVEHCTDTGSAVLVGHSMGGLVSVTAAATHPDRVEGAVLVDTRILRPDPVVGASPRGLPGRPLRPYPSHEAATRAFRLLPQQPIVNPGVFSYIAGAAAVESDGAWRWRFDPDIAQRFDDVLIHDQLLRIRCPVEIIHGAQSTLVTAEVNAEIISMLGRPIPVTTVPNAHHHVLLDQPIATMEAVDAAVGRIRATASSVGSA